MDEEGPILTMEQVGERIGRSLNTLRYWRRIDQSLPPAHRGDPNRWCGPPSFKLGRRVYYSERDLNTWIATQRRRTLTSGPMLSAPIDTRRGVA